MNNKYSIFKEGDLTEITKEDIDSIVGSTAGDGGGTGGGSGSSGGSGDLSDYEGDITDQDIDDIFNNA